MHNFHKLCALTMNQEEANSMKKDKVSTGNTAAKIIRVASPPVEVAGYEPYF